MSFDHPDQASPISHRAGAFDRLIHAVGPGCHHPAIWPVAAVLLLAVSFVLASWFTWMGRVTWGVNLLDGRLFAVQPWDGGSRLLYPDLGCEAPGSTADGIAKISSFAAEDTEKKHPNSGLDDDVLCWQMGHRLDLPVVFCPCLGTYLVTPSLAAHLLGEGL